MLRAGVAALRASPLRTALSAIGVVIGVGAMVSVLALSDGVERAFRERMAADGRLVTVRVAPRMADVVDGQAFARRETVAFTPADARALAARLGDTADVHLLASTPGLVAAVAPGTAGTPPAPRGVVLRGVLRPPPGAARRGLAAGRFFTGAEAAGRARVLVVDYALAARLLADRGRLTAGALPGGAALTPLLAEPVWVGAAAWRVVGVLAPDADDTAAVRAVGQGDVPWSDRSGAGLGAAGPAASSTTTATSASRGPRSQTARMTVAATSAMTACTAQLVLSGRSGRP